MPPPALYPHRIGPGRGNKIAGTPAYPGKGPAGEDFYLEYDKLLIATGASARLPDVPGIETPGLMSLKNLADGRAIKDYIKDKKVGRVLIIGMGYVGPVWDPLLTGAGQLLKKM